MSLKNTGRGRADLIKGHEELKDLVYVDNAGVLRMRHKKTTKSPTGERYVNIRSQNARDIKIGGRLYTLQANHVAWYLHTGVWPRDGVVRCINGRKSDLRPENLMRGDINANGEPVNKYGMVIDTRAEQNTAREKVVDKKPQIGGDIPVVVGCYITEEQIVATANSQQWLNKIMHHIKNSFNTGNRIHFSELLSYRKSPGHRMPYLALRHDVIGQYVDWLCKQELGRLKYKLQLMDEHLHLICDDDDDPMEYIQGLREQIKKIHEMRNEAIMYASPSSGLYNPRVAAKIAGDLSGMTVLYRLIGAGNRKEIAQKQNEHLLKLLAGE